MRVVFFADSGKKKRKNRKTCKPAKKFRIAPYMCSQNVTSPAWIQKLILEYFLNEVET